MGKKSLNIDSDEMMAIVSVMRGMRLFSKHHTTASLFEYLQREEICERADGKLHWQKPMLKLFKQIEDKFNKRLQEHGL